MVIISIMRRGLDDSAAASGLMLDDQLNEGTHGDHQRNKDNVFH